MRQDQVVPIQRELSPGSRNATSRATSSHPKLSPREVEVLMLLCDGLSTKEIGNELGLSPKTVEFHRYNLGKKIGANEIALMVRWAIRHKIIQA